MKRTDLAQRSPKMGKASIGEIARSLPWERTADDGMHRPDFISGSARLWVVGCVWVVRCQVVRTKKSRGPVKSSRNAGLLT